MNHNRNLKLYPGISRLVRQIGNAATSAIALCTFVHLLNIAPASGQDSTKHWVGTWAAAPYKVDTSSNYPSKTLTNNTIRQIVRVSIGGNTLRLKFSNITSSNSVTIQKTNIAVSPDGTKSAVDGSTITELTFNGNSGITINAKSEVYSDPVAFDLDTSMRVAITIYYGQCESSKDMTFHYGSRTDSYILDGDKTSSVDFSGATIKTCWYTICGIDVLAPKSAYAVAAIGNSITDGASLKGGLQNRWTDRFSEALLANEPTSEVGVLNLGIGATLVTAPSNGAEAGVDRFEHDILEQSGLHWVIIFYGVNDLAGDRSADEIFNGIKQMAEDAHAKDTSIKVYGGTITPFNGHSYYSDAHEAVRNQINDMIRTSKALDGYIDFAEAIADPNDPSKMKQEYSEGGWNDWLHPGPAGHEAMGKSIDLDMFTPPSVSATRPENRTSESLKAVTTTLTNGTFAINFNLSEQSFVSLRVYSILGKEIAEYAGTTFSRGNHRLAVDNVAANGMYLYTLTTDRYVANGKVIIPNR